MRVASHDIRPRPSANEVIGTAGALLLLAFLTFALYWAIVLLSFQSDACSGHACNGVMFGISIYAMPVAGIIVFATSIVLAVVLARRDRPPWLPAVIGCSVIVVVFVLAAILNWWSALDWGPL